MLTRALTLALFVARARDATLTLLAMLSLCAGEGRAAGFAEPVSLGEGVYVFLGALEEPSRANRGDTANEGFIVAPEGVIVIDSGASAAFAEHMLRAIRARTPQPVVMVILTRPIDTAIFGATVFQAQGAVIVAHQAAATLIAERCRTCLANLTSALGPAVMSDTRVPVPDRLVAGTHRVVVAGRTLELLDFTGAAAPGSIAVWDSASRVLFAGGLASFGRVPETRDGDLSEWMRALNVLSGVPARAVVPAHGRVGTPAQLREVAAYLQALDRATANAYDAGVSLLEAPQAVSVPEAREWALYRPIHPRNVHHAYLARERRALERGTDSP